MTTHALRYSVCWLVACLLATLALNAAATRTELPPNVILIMVDDFGYECVGANGSTSYSTPNIDRLAASGMRFNHCYVQPLCTPTRVQLMTGQYNVRNYVRFGELIPSATTFAHLFRKAGYATAIAGKWQLGHGIDLPRHFGFDESCLWQHTRRPPRYANPGLEINGEQKDYENGDYGPDLVNQFALDFISRNRDRPFLLYYPMILTHDPFQPTPESADWDPTARGEKVNNHPRHFAGMVHHTDQLVGRILQQLEKLQLRERTLILFLGDNGTHSRIVSQLNGRPYRGGKGQPTAAGMHVPLIANYPGVIPAGQVCSDLVDSTDFLPTLCAAAKIPVPARLTVDGRSFWPQLQGEPGQPRAWIYCWYARNGGPTAQHEFAFDRHLKLYRDDRAFAWLSDPEEIAPLDPTQIEPSTRASLDRLRSVLNSFSKARPAAIAHPATATAP